MERMRGFQTMFADGRLTLGLFVPIESYQGSTPTMRDHLALAQEAEQTGFAAIWVGDVPLLDPSFGDAGQIFDPWVYLGFLAASTHTIALATGSIVLPLRHPLHVAKAAASVDQLSGGRLVLGLASGDRAVEFPAFGLDAEERGERFREALAFLRRALEEYFPEIDSPLGMLSGTDLIPKPVAGRLPFLITGSSRQSFEWIAAHGDGWVTYPRPLAAQAELAAKWRRLTAAATPGRFKPFAQSLYIDLAENRHAAPTAIHLGFRLGSEPLIDLLRSLQTNGFNHIAFNLKYGHRPAADVLQELGSEVLPHFPTPSQRADQNLAHPMYRERLTTAMSPAPAAMSSKPAEVLRIHR
jgi:luciferase-type oxidoreductase